MIQATYSEETMADAFEQRLRSRRPLRGVGRFREVFREVDCHRGRPDFIGLSSRFDSGLAGHDGRHSLAVACLLSLLGSRSPRSAAWLAMRSGLSRQTVRRSIRAMVAAGLAREASPDRLVLSGGVSIFETEAAAFELKLNNPRRAVFQAQQYTFFAQQVWVVTPPARVNGLDAYRPAIERWGIGVASFDPSTHRFTVIRAARRRTPVSREHQAYAVLQLLRRLRS